MSKTRPTWFVTLRRDRGLFALVGSLVLLLNVLQPAVAARAGDGAHWAICTIYGVEKPVERSDLPAAWPDECPICIAGHSAGNAPVKAVFASEPAFLAPEPLADAAFETDRGYGPGARPGDPPPAIRAPPSLS